MTTASKASAPVALSGGSFDFSGLVGFFQRLSAARRAAAAIASERRPAKSDLKTLGLDTIDIMFDFRSLPH
jgi:hypothetical protein